MKMESISLLEWQNRFGSEEACAEALKKVRWPDGFICPEWAGKEFGTILPLYQGSLLFSRSASENTRS